MYIFPSQSVVTFYLAFRYDLMCRECSFPAYLTPKLSMTRVKLMGRLSYVYSPGWFLLDGIRMVTGIGRGNHVWSCLLVVFHTCPWLLLQRCTHCVPCNWGFRKSWVLLGLCIYGSWCIVIDPCSCWGRNILRPCTCSGILCLRWHYCNLV